MPKNPGGKKVKYPKGNTKPKPKVKTTTRRGKR